MLKIFPGIFFIFLKSLLIISKLNEAKNMERDLLGLDKETGFSQKGFCGDDCLYDCSGFLSFVQESLQITMVDYNCYYTPVINAFVIEFSYEGNKYQLLKHNLNDVPEYILSLINEDELLDRFVVLVRTNDFNEIKIINKK